MDSLECLMGARPPKDVINEAELLFHQCLLRKKLPFQKIAAWQCSPLSSPIQLEAQDPVQVGAKECCRPPVERVSEGAMHQPNQQPCQTILQLETALDRDSLHKQRSTSGHKGVCSNSCTRACIGSSPSSRETK